MSKYNTLLRILDELRKEAPIEHKRYYPLESNIDQLNNARSRAYIHLFLKVKFGLINFNERESFITDDDADAGIDGYFIDQENKRIYFIQSKFRTNEKNFENKKMELEDLLKMELDRVTKGERFYANGVKYNKKIQKLIDEIQNIGDFPKYKETVILLVNLDDKYKDKIKPITLFPTEIYDHERCYNELVFPIVSGTFFNPKELKITIVVNTKSAGNRIDYYVDTAIKECNITALFVPTIEIAKVLYKYKNSVLKFNPRSYLELAAGSVNRRIQESILEITTNEFALYNNGITMLSDNTFYSDRVGKKNEAELIVTNPQLINGGQTAYTLSRIYEDHFNSGQSLDVFDNKEVLLKVITFSEDEQGPIEEKNKLQLIEAISKATNDQTEVTEADRRSNDKIQIELQTNIFKEFGYFYERKRGEFGDGLRSKYIDRSKIVDREILLRICLSIYGNPGQARRASTKQLFLKDTFGKIMISSEYEKYFFGYKAYEYLSENQRKFEKDKNNKYGQAQYGNGLRYGKIAMLGVIANDFENKKNECNDEEIKKATDIVLSKWMNFEEYIKVQPENALYFTKHTDEDTGKETVEVNFDNYYKGRTVANNLKKFFKLINYPKSIN